MTGPAPLVVRGLSVSYGPHRILHDVTVPALAPGEITVFAGPNGAGKSTLLKAVAGAVKASGDLHLGDRDLTALPARERAGLVGFMPQSGTAATRLTVLETVIASLRLFGAGRSMAACRDRALATLERLGILEMASTPLHTLSGGQRQLAVLAQSLVRDPRVLLLDEPTSALDLRHQFEVMTVLRSIADEGRIVVLVLHDLALAARWADQFVFLEGGRVVASGPTADTLSAATIRALYGVEAEVTWDAQGGPRVHIQGLAAP